MSKIPFFQGKNDRGWTPDVDYLIRNDENVDKMLNTKVKTSGWQPSQEELL